MEDAALHEGRDTAAGAGPGAGAQLVCREAGPPPQRERPGGLRYTIGGSEFVLFASAGASDGSFTQMGLEVADHKATVAELRRRGVAFEEYDDGPLATTDGVVTVEGNYPDKGIGEYGAWFRDSEGNLLGLGQSF